MVIGFSSSLSAGKNEIINFLILRPWFSINSSLKETFCFNNNVVPQGNKDVLSRLRTKAMSPMTHKKKTKSVLTMTNTIFSSLD